MVHGDGRPAGRGGARVLRVARVPARARPAREGAAHQSARPPGARPRWRGAGGGSLPVRCPGVRDRQFLLALHLDLRGERGGFPVPAAGAAAGGGGTTASARDGPTVRGRTTCGAGVLARRLPGGGGGAGDQQRARRPRRNVRGSFDPGSSFRGVGRPARRAVAPGRRVVAAVEESHLPATARTERVARGAAGKGGSPGAGEDRHLLGLPLPLLPPFRAGLRSVRRRPDRPARRAPLPQLSARFDVRRAHAARAPSRCLRDGARRHLRESPGQLLGLPRRRLSGAAQWARC